MVDITGFYDSLLQASFGGVDFCVVDISQEIGRRVQRWLFPGLDTATYQDLGEDDGPISLRGLLYGVDYITQMKNLQAVFYKAGPYQLVHPWLGALQVMPVNGQRPRFTLSATELQICRFEIQLYRFVVPKPEKKDWLTKLEDRVTSLTDKAEAWLASALGPLMQGEEALSFAQGWLGNAVGIFTQAMSLTASAGQIGATVSGTLAGIVGAVGTVTEDFPTTAAASVNAMLASWAGSATPTVPCAVAPGGALTAALAADPTDVTTTLLAALPGIVRLGNGPAPAPALSGAVQASVVASAVQAASSINYASQQDARAMGAKLYVALDGAVGAAAALAINDPLNITPVWRGLLAVKAALAADLNALIGRLPAVVVIHTTRAMPLWLLAQYAYGDTPSQIFPMWQDMIARNNVRNPALLLPGAVELLNQ